MRVKLGSAAAFALALAATPSVSADQSPLIEPPAAFVETSARTVKMATGGFCWEGLGCVARGPVQVLPLVTVRRGATVWFRFGFEPSAVFLQRPHDPLSPRALRASDFVRWRVRGTGIFRIRVEARVKKPSGGEGQVAYFARLKVVPRTPCPAGHF